MVINRDGNDYSNIEFVSYTGKYPNLCSGVLTLRICGEECVFGHNCEDFDCKTGLYKDENYDKFWISGGCIGGDGVAYRDEWNIICEELPKKYRKYVDEIDRVFNDNVEWGCCGGCS